MSIPFLKASLVVMGVSSITAQILLMRELLVSYLGNELTLGIILANWMVLEAAGAFVLGKSAKRMKGQVEVYVLFQILFSLALPISIYLARTFKNFLLPTPGEALGLVPILYSSFLILLPAALTHGALFTYGCRLFSINLNETASSVGKVYVLETAGSVVGGVLISFLLIHYFTSIEIALVISLTNALISLPLLSREKNLSGNLLHLSSLLLTLLFGALLFSSAAGKIHAASLRSQWKGLQLLHNQNTIYGNIAVTKQGEQFTFFTDGTPSLTTPVPDIASIEDFVHFPMLLHENPRSVLVLTGGAGGMISEVLKHPVNRVDYVELDPALLKLVREFRTPLTEAELSDGRVNIHYEDARSFVGKASNRFDLIFIGLPYPRELRTNRLFSLEFFSMMKRKMNPGGMVALTLPGSLTYISPELRDLNGCILNTLRSAYRHVKIIPGETNLYLASDSKGLMGTGAQDVMKRLEARKVSTSLFIKGYVEDRLHRRGSEWFSQSMEGGTARINSDFRPLGVFYSQSYWNALFSPYLTGIYRWFEGFGVKSGLALLAAFTLLSGAVFLKRPSTSACAVPYAILTSGFAVMIFDLAVIYAFQILYGYLYYEIGLLIAAFMAGIALAGHVMNRLLERIRRSSRLLILSELWIIALALLLPFLSSIPAQPAEKPLLHSLLYGMIFGAAFLSGASLGLQFPLAARSYLNASPGRDATGRTAGLLYGADLLGGFSGGLLGGVLLLPILGLKGTCFTVALIKGSSLALLILFSRLSQSRLLQGPE
jgi:spermidine synthase